MVRRQRRHLCLTKGQHRYVFSYTEGQEPAVLAQLVAMAGDPQSGLDWLDAAALSYELGRASPHECGAAV